MFFCLRVFFLFRKFNLNLILLTQKDKLHAMIAMLPIAWLHDTILKIRCVSHLVSSYSFLLVLLYFLMLSKVNKSAIIILFMCVQLEEQHVFWS